VYQHLSNSISKEARFDKILWAFEEINLIVLISLVGGLWDNIIINFTSWALEGVHKRHSLYEVFIQSFRRKQDDSYILIYTAKVKCQLPEM